MEEVRLLRCTWRRLVARSDENQLTAVSTDCKMRRHESGQGYFHLRRSSGHRSPGGHQSFLSELHEENALTGPLTRTRTS